MSELSSVDGPTLSVSNSYQNKKKKYINLENGKPWDVLASDNPQNPTGEKIRSGKRLLSDKI